MSDVIAGTIGLHFPRERWKDLERGLDAAARELGLEDAAACATRLLEATPSRQQLQVLASHLTIGETYFFRDTKLFDALRGSILPQLIEPRRGRERRLRLWSAGCCTGEEPYSLAILVHELLPDLRDWHVTIMATDVNPRFLQKAAAGVYGEWSFRGVPETLRKRYFHAVAGGRFALRPEIKRLVTFAQLNLVQDLFPSITTDTNAMDVIFCRNVLMYFTPEQMQRVAASLRQALLPGGWLVVSPSEASHALFPGFASVSFPGAILFRRDAEVARRAARPAPSAAIAAPPRDSSPVATRHAPAQGLPPPSRPLPPQPAPPAAAPPAQDFSSNARACANDGDLDAALQWCDRWIAADRVNAAAHYLRAMVLLEKGALDEAARALQRTVFLEPGYVMAQVSWGNLEHARGLEAEAQRHFLNALRIVERMAPDDAVADSDGLTAGRLAETLAALTSSGGP